MSLVKNRWHWLRWVSFHLQGPSIFQKATYVGFRLTPKSQAKAAHMGLEHLRSLGAEIGRQARGPNVPLECFKHHMFGHGRVSWRGDVRGTHCLVSGLSTFWEDRFLWQTAVWTCLVPICSGRHLGPLRFFLLCQWFAFVVWGFEPRIFVEGMWETTPGTPPRAPILSLKPKWLC